MLVLIDRNPRITLFHPDVKGAVSIAENLLSIVYNQEFEMKTVKRSVGLRLFVRCVLGPPVHSADILSFG